MITHVDLDTKVMEMETVSQKVFKQFVQMDSFKDQMENVFYLQQYVMSDTKVMEMEIVFQLQ